MSSIAHVQSEKTITILLVEDDKEQYLITRDMLRQATLDDYTLEWVSEYDSAMTALEARHVSVCLLDYKLGKHNGLKLLKKFGKDLQAPPIIFLTNEADIKLDKKAMDYGAEDFLDKSTLTMEQLERSIRHAIAHRHDQRELVRKEAHYHHIVDASLNAIVVIDEEGAIIEWNFQAEKMFGWNQSEVLGKKLENFIMPDRYVDMHKAGMRHYLETGEARILDKELDLSAMTKAGDEIDIKLTVTSVSYTDRVNFVAFIEDTSKRRQAEEITRRYKQIVETTSDMMAFINTDYVYLAVNHAYISAFGKEYDEIIGHHVSELFADYYDDIKKYLDRCLSGEDVFFEKWINFNSTGLQYMQFHYNPFCDANGNVTGIAVNSRDLTEQKYTEDELRRKSVLLGSVSDIQSEFITQSDNKTFFSNLLRVSMWLSRSHAGFIGMKHRIGNVRQQLDIHSLITDDPDQENESEMSRKHVDDFDFDGLGEKLTDLLENGKRIINNEPSGDLPASLFPRDNIKIENYLVLPLNQGNEVIGLIGLANRGMDYDNELIDYLSPLIDTSTGIITAINTREKQKEAERKYQYLYDENPAMFFTIARDGAIISINAFGQEQLGYPNQDFANMTLFDILHPSDRQLARLTLVDIFARPDEITSWEMRMRHSNGKAFWVRNTARVVSTKNYQDAALVVCEDITQTRELSEELSYQATHDPLTGFVNRREFERRLSNSINHARVHHVEHALCYIDLDQFKVINDTAGHSAGDNLLRQLAAVLNTKIRQRDTLSRVGGDEFAVLVEHCTLNQAKRVAEMLRQTITDFSFPWEDRQFRIGASIGVVPINQASTDMVEVMRIADSACYAAKDAGRNSIHVYEESDEAIRERRGEMLWVERVQNAIEMDKFVLYYQPIVPVSATDRQMHYEILLRMQNDDGTMIPPGAFLPASERYNIIGKVDRWVIRQVFRWLKQNPKAQSELSLCSINLSGQSFGDETMLGFIREQMMLYNVDPEKICFEITETAAITNLNNAIQFMRECRSYGFHFALDDFGSGLSSFGYLKTLPVDFVKIDGIFVRELARSNIDRAMVKSINEVAHVMEKITIAEFVEDNDILDILQDFGVDYAQGYGIGKPAPLDDLAD